MRPCLLNYSFDLCVLTWLPSFLFLVKCLRKQSSHLSGVFLLNSLQLILISSFTESLVWLDPFSVMDSSVANGPYFYALWSECSLWHYEFLSLGPLLQFYRNIWFTSWNPSVTELTFLHLFFFFAFSFPILSISLNLTITFVSMRILL